MSWDVSNVEDMRFMFNGAIGFATLGVEDVTVWNICKVLDGNFQGMFTNAGQPDTNLVPPANGICTPCPSGTTSGSGEYVTGGNNCTSV